MVTTYPKTILLPKCKFQDHIVTLAYVDLTLGPDND